MRSTVEDVHHGHGQRIGARAAEITIERQTVFRCSRARCRHGDRQNRVRSQPALVLGAIQFDHLLIKSMLVISVPIRQRIRDLTINALHCFEHSFAEKTRIVPVAQFDGLMLAGRCSAGHNGAASRAIRQLHFRFHSRIAARIQHLAPDDGCNIRHTTLPFFL